MQVSQRRFKDLMCSIESRVPSILFSSYYFDNINIRSMYYLSYTFQGVQNTFKRRVYHI